MKGGLRRWGMGGFAPNDHNGNAGALEGFRRFPGQFLLGEVENRTIRQPFCVAFAALSHRDDVLGEDCTASGGILFRCPRSLALLHSTPSIVERILQDTNLVRMKNVRRKLL